MVALDFKKTPSDRRVGFWIGPKGSIANFDAPTAAEINAMIRAPESVSWNDFDFGLQASETANDPSLADASNYEEFGQANYGGSVSFYYPREYDDNSNLHSTVYDLTSEPHTELEIVIRIDGDVRNNRPAEDGDFVSVYATMTDSEANNITGSDAYRRTVGMLQRENFAHRVPVGSPVVTVDGPTTVEAGGHIALTGVVAGRNYTNGLRWRSLTPEFATVSAAGIVTGVAAGAAEILVENEGTGESEVVNVTVS